MYFIIKYLKHLIFASNQHGVHSPFVYEFVTKCLYAKPNIEGSKSEGVLLKSIPYFSVENLKLNTHGDEIANKIRKRFDLKLGKKNPYDLIYVDKLDSQVVTNYKETIHNDSMLLLGHIHRNKNSTAIWEALSKDEFFNVSIDMFHCGALFIRKEQRKEHFKIRI